MNFVFVNKNTLNIQLACYIILNVDLVLNYHAKKTYGGGR
jgi:hypothetical protein